MTSFTEFMLFYFLVFSFPDFSALGNYSDTCDKTEFDEMIGEARRREIQDSWENTISSEDLWDIGYHSSLDRCPADLYKGFFQIYAEHTRKFMEELPVLKKMADAKQGRGRFKRRPSRKFRKRPRKTWRPRKGQKKSWRSRKGWKKTGRWHKKSRNAWRSRMSLKKDCSTFSESPYRDGPYRNILTSFKSQINLHIGNGDDICVLPIMQSATYICQYKRLFDMVKRVANC